MFFFGQDCDVFWKRLKKCVRESSKKNEVFDVLTDVARGERAHAPLGIVDPFGQRGPLDGLRAPAGAGILDREGPKVILSGTFHKQINDDKAGYRTKKGPLGTRELFLSWNESFQIQYGSSQICKFLYLRLTGGGGYFLPLLLFHDISQIYKRIIAKF